jgi:hypothetical protein
MLDFGLTVLHKVVRVLTNPRGSRPTSPAKDRSRTAGLSMHARRWGLDQRIGRCSRTRMRVLEKAQSSRTGKIKAPVLRLQTSNTTFRRANQIGVGAGKCRDGSRTGATSRRQIGRGHVTTCPTNEPTAKKPNWKRLFLVLDLP